MARLAFFKLVIHQKATEINKVAVNQSSLMVMLDPFHRRTASPKFWEGQIF